MSTDSQPGPLLSQAIAVAAAAVGCLLAGCGAEDTAAMPEPRTVLVTPAVAAGTLERRFSGTLRAAERAELAFEVSGPISSIAVDLGDLVSRGQQLAALDPTPFRLNLQARKAGLASAAAELQDAQRDYERRSALAASDAVSEAVVDAARARLDRARAQVDAQEADIANAQERLDDATLIAPYDGEITARLAEPSEVTAAGRPVLHMIGTGTRIEAVVDVPADVLRALAVGDMARIAYGRTPDLTAGRVAELGAAANRAGLFPVTLSIGEGQAPLRPGEAIEATFELGNEDAGLLIPLTAFVAREDGSATVFVIDSSTANARVRARRVQLLALRSDGAEVTGELAADELIVSKGAEYLTDGEPVLTAGDGPARYYTE